ncbi:MAG: hypothetical protein JRN44_03845 [Nitrososphaerota archaeon]|jgi:hypothetical protein|nr:hypothetical protein [Nitrososphaerota archaeon]MDG6947636.1 hypothetical protein [Nitrososphaerota archaeon]
MDVWRSMYMIVWAAFFQIIFILFSPLNESINIGVHVVVALAILVLAFHVYRSVGRTSCPGRIKRITKATWYLAVLQAILGGALVLGIMLAWGSLYVDVVSFLHVVNALAIITQASSSATAYDMWEEKEFQITAVSPPSP